MRRRRQHKGLAPSAVITTIAASRCKTPPVCQECPSRSKRPSAPSERTVMKSARFFQNRLALALVVAALCIAADQATKEIARRTLPDTGRHSYFGDTVRLEFALNQGGFLSLGGQ